MITITNVEAAQRVLAHLDEGRLTRRNWHTTESGRELACVLGSMDPAISDPTDCPASVMPAWLAWLTVALFDRQSDADAMAWARRYAVQMARWHVLDGAAWNRVGVAFRIACVETAMRKAEPGSKDLAVWPRVRAACEGVVAALRTGVGLAEARREAATAAYTAGPACNAAHAAYAAHVACGDIEAAAACAYTAGPACNAAHAAFAAYADAAADDVVEAAAYAYAYATGDIEAAAAYADAAELANALCDLIDGELEVRR